jgi:transcriptional regulator with XRE-family HTH domain
MDKNIFGQKVKTRRLSLGLSPSELAAHLEISRGTLWRIEKGLKVHEDYTNALDYWLKTGQYRPAPPSKRMKPWYARIRVSR